MTSFYTSMSGLKNAETDLRVIAHNIANTETTGFKKSNVQFSDIVSAGTSGNPRVSIGIGATTSVTNQTFTLGAIEQTGRSLDLAIDGDGFFATRNPGTSELLFTRNGNFTMDATGSITDSADHVLQAFPVDAAGNPSSTTPQAAQVPLTNAAGSALSGIRLDSKGALLATYIDGSTDTVGVLALANFPAIDGLSAIGQTKWRPTGLSGAPQFGEAASGGYGALMTGSLERSNVDLAEEMVGLITAQRNFQANARAIDTSTQIAQTVINLQS